MGEVAVKLKIYPENMDDFEGLKSKITSELKPKAMSEEPIAFGLKAIIATIVIEDSAGGSDLLEEKASKIPGVSQVQVEEASRLL